MLEVLCLPHLVLANIRDDDRLVLTASRNGLTPDVVNNVRGVQVAIVGQRQNVAHGGGAL